MLLLVRYIYEKIFQPHVLFYVTGNAPGKNFEKIELGAIVGKIFFKQEDVGYKKNKEWYENTQKSTGIMRNYNGMSVMGDGS